MSAPVIMLTSGKGGTGKSTASALLGAQLALRGKRVLVVELATALRSLDTVCGVCGKTVYDLGDILAGRCAPEKAVVESALYPGLFVICAPYQGSGHIDTAAFAVLVARMRSAFDFILLDTAAGLGSPFSAAVAVSTAALVVTTPDAICLRSARVVADALFDAKHVQVRLLLSRVPPALCGRGVADLDACIDAIGAQLIGVLPESEAMLHAFSTGAPLPPHCPAERALAAVAARICGHEAPLVIA